MTFISTIGAPPDRPSSRGRFCRFGARAANGITYAFAPSRSERHRHGSVGRLTEVDDLAVAEGDHVHHRP
jgi:hypothetical protein